MRFLQSRSAFQSISYRISRSPTPRGLLFYGIVTIPFVDRFPRGEIYDLLTTRPEDLPHERKRVTRRARGQSVPKSKFRERAGRKANRTGRPSCGWNAGEKLEDAREKLAKQKPPKKPGAVKRLWARRPDTASTALCMGNSMKWNRKMWRHRAHRSELGRVRVPLRHALRKAIGNTRQRLWSVARVKYIKATADYHYRMTAEEHPEMSGRRRGVPVSGESTKIKRQYAKQAREAARQTGAARPPRRRPPPRAKPAQKCPAI